MVDWSMGVSDPRAFYQGSEYVNKLYDMQGQKAAGALSLKRQEAADARTAAGDARLAKADAQSDADRKAEQFKTQHAYLQRAVPVLTGILQKAGPQKLLEAFDQLGGELQQMGIPPEAVAQYRQAFTKDPQGTLQALGATAQRKFQFQKVGDDVIVLDEADPSKPVATFKAEPKAPAGPSQADLLRNANSPFDAQGQPNVQVQDYERGKADRAAAAIADRQRQPEPKAPQSRTVARGNEIVEEEYNPATGQWSEIGRAPRSAAGAGPSARVTALAKQKISGLAAIENQLNRVEQAMVGTEATATSPARAGVEKSGYTGYLAGNVPGGLDAESDVFDKSVAQLAPLIRQLTRVPGEGSMSDYEGRLAALTLPSRRDTPEGRREALEGMRELIREIRAGYSELLASPSPQGASDAPSQSQGGGSGRVIDFNSLPD